MPFIRLLFFLTLAAAVVGCESTKGTYESKKQDGYQGKIVRLMLLTPNATTRKFLGDGFYAGFTAGLSKGIPEKGAAFMGIEPKDSSDDVGHDVGADDAQAQALFKRFHPTHLLWLSDVKRGFADSGYKMIEIGYDLQDVQTKKRVWHTHGVYYGEPDPEQIALEIVQELVKSGLL